MILITVAIASLMGSAAADGDDDIEPVRRWIERQASMKSAVVQFTQERRLRSLRKPIIKDGTFWLRAPSTFRWQVGEPPEIVAIQEEGGDLFVVNEKEKKIDQYPYKTVVERGSRNGLTFLEAGFPRDLASFQKNFKIISVKENQGFHEVQTQLTDRRASLGCRKIVFFLDLKSHELRHVHLYFRDGSIVTNRFNSIQMNASIPDSRFTVQTTGYTVERKK